MVALTKTLNQTNNLFSPYTKTVTVTLTSTLFFFLNKTWPWSSFLNIVNLNISTQFWNSLFDEIISYWKTCSISSSQNDIHKFLAAKLIIQRLLQIKRKHLFVWSAIQFYSHSDISSLSALNATFPALSHAQTDWKKSSTTKVIRKLVDLLQRFGVLHHVKKIATRPVFMC